MSQDSSWFTKIMISPSYPQLAHSVLPRIKLVDNGLKPDDGKQAAGEGHDAGQSQDDDSQQRLRACNHIHTSLLRFLQQFPVAFFCRLGGLGWRLLLSSYLLPLSFRRHRLIAPWLGVSLHVSQPRGDHVILNSPKFDYFTRSKFKKTPAHKAKG